LASAARDGRTIDGSNIRCLLAEATWAEVTWEGATSEDTATWAGATCEATSDVAPEKLASGQMKLAT
jgi:hypothetical protein